MYCCNPRAHDGITPILPIQALDPGSLIDACCRHVINAIKLQRDGGAV
jgi:hypothetical protein